MSNAKDRRRSKFKQGPGLPNKIAPTAFDMAIQEHNGYRTACRDPKLVKYVYANRNNHRDCGKCDGCMAKKRSAMAFRLQTETQGQRCAFLTLTIDPENMWRFPPPSPQVDIDGNPKLNRKTGEPLPLKINSKPISAFIKRVRRSMDYHEHKDAKFRYFVAAEFGDEHGRLHFHIILIGMSGCSVSIEGRVKNCQCKKCLIIRQAWPYGFFRLETPKNPEAISKYITAYVVKKSHTDNPYDARPKTGERHWGSKHIGVAAVKDLAQSFEKVANLVERNEQGEMIGYDGTGKPYPHEVQTSVGPRPLVSYQRKKLAQELRLAPDYKMSLAADAVVSVIDRQDTTIRLGADLGLTPQQSLVKTGDTIRARRAARQKNKPRGDLLTANGSVKP